MDDRSVGGAILRGALVSRAEASGIIAASGVVYALIAWANRAPHDRLVFGIAAALALALAAYLATTARRRREALKQAREATLKTRTRRNGP